MLWISIDNGSAAERLAARPRRFAGLAGALRDAAQLAAIWTERACQRNALAELDDRQLRDIGLTRGEAVRESSMPFWRTSR